MKRILLAGGTGFIGQALVEHWLQQKEKPLITVISRHDEKIKRIFQNRVTALSWHAFHQNHENVLKNIDVIINCCGVNIGEARWTTQRRRDILHSRVDTTSMLAQYCAQRGKQAPRLFIFSAVSVYGLQQPAEPILPDAFDEQSQLPQSDHHFLVNVAQAVEQAANAAEKAGACVVKCRLGVVLGKNGGAFPQLIFPFRYFMGGPLGNGYQPFAWISIRDLCRAIDLLIDNNSFCGAVNCVAKQTTTQREFAHAVGRRMNRPSFLPTPSWILQSILGYDRANELLLSGTHTVPTRLGEMGFSFDDPDIETVLKNLL